MSFLKARELTTNDYNHIRTVCKELTELKKFMKAWKLRLKNTIESAEDE